ncbi:hypothetical protein [Sutcliffiella deserti]|uniref:hypothetical protein n=1 Tax=Sutcliffiella deserti TaxID=2875501 RepID=UPI001CC155F5|nr:hypothetical protein [Sutcliffiella deserti]
MKKTSKILMTVLATLLLLAGCQTSPFETMVLLDETLAEVNVAKSEGAGDMNLILLHSFDDKETVAFFKEAITTARNVGDSPLENPDYDVMVEYKATEEGSLPAHGIHLWLGEADEKSYFMYMIGDEVYETSAKTTNRMRAYILESGEE